MKTVFILQHEREAEGPKDCDDVKFIGAFSTKKKAESAICQLIKKPGFKKYPSGFSIDEYTIDEIHWLSGFGMD
jgi:hypothetical protein